MTGIDRQTQVEGCPSCGKQFPLNTGACPIDGAELIQQVKDPLIGVLLPRNYRIVNRLGRGAMSVVYQGLYEPLRQPVAIKLLKSHLVSEFSAFRRFQQEAKTAGALDHPNIVEIFDFGVTDQGVPYLVMELLQGESLSQRLARIGQMPLQEALNIFIQTADALDYTHQRGVIHRDVKPSNILIKQDEQGQDVVKLADFGIAKLESLDSMTATGEVFGTPLYVSPEQAMGRPLDHRADIYSLGCVMYEAIAGRPPLRGPSAFDIIRLQISMEPEPLQNVRTDHPLPPSLLDVVSISMSKDPECRYQTMAELLVDLNRAEVELLTGIRKNDSSSSFTPTEPFKSLKIMFSTASKASAAAAPLAQTQTLVEPSEQVESTAKSSGNMPPPSIPSRSTNSRRASWLSPVIFACIAGCLAGATLLFLMDQKSKWDQASRIVPGPTIQTKSAPALEIMDKETEQIKDNATALRDGGSFDEAEAMLRKALVIVRSKQQNVAESILLADLCEVQIQQHQYTNALKSGQAALSILDTEKDAPQDAVANALHAVATSYYYLKQPEKAEPILVRAIALDQNVFGENSNFTASDLTLLARVYEYQNQPQAAEKYYKEAISIAERRHGKGESNLARRLKNYADFLRRQNRTTEAIPLETRATKVGNG